jgi:hypothetical protein
MHPDNMLEIAVASGDLEGLRGLLRQDNEAYVAQLALVFGGAKVLELVERSVVSPSVLHKLLVLSILCGRESERDRFIERLCGAKRKWRQRAGALPPSTLIVSALVASI